MKELQAPFEEPIEQEQLDMIEKLRKSALRKTSAKAVVGESVDAPDAETDEEGSALQTLKRHPVKKKEALLEKLKDIKLEADFVERLDVVDKVGLDVEDIEDDLKREVEFYNQALRAVKYARTELDKADVKYLRPIDYFAEMIKTDEHMNRVKQHLLFEKQKMESFEKRKQQKEYKKFAKQLQAEKQKEKAEKKKKAAEIAEEFRNTTKGRDFTLLSQRSKKRLANEKKYGFGGRKRLKKKNDATSVNDVSDFSVKRNKQPFPGIKVKSQKSKKRLGKSRRKRLK